MPAIIHALPDGAVRSPVEPEPRRCVGACARWLPDPADAPAEDLSIDELRQRAMRRGRAALARVATAPDRDDPLVATVHRFAVSIGQPVHPAALLASWRTRPRAASGDHVAFPWGQPHDGRPGSPSYDPPVAHRARPGGCASVRGAAADACGRRLASSIVLAESLELLLELAAHPDPSVAATAGYLAAETRPAIEGDVAGYVAGGDPWRDTFALWVLTRHPLAFDALHALVVALGFRYATLAARSAGVLLPAHATGRDEPLVSATAQLAGSLWMLGLYPSLIPGLAGHVARARRPDGGWADADRPADLLTTLVAADLLATIDPDFDPEPTVTWFARTQEGVAGWWRQLGPEVPWLTAEVVAWLEASARPFADRFRWPAAPRWDRDRKTSLPTIAYFSDLARSLDGLPGLRRARMELAFIDLARFRDFNNRHGQVEGDRLLRRFAFEIAGIPGARAVRDGGDEFLVLGAPTRTGLADELADVALRWRGIVRDGYGTSVATAPRIIVGSTPGDEILAARERLGRAIGEVKHDHDVPPEGLVLSV